jgi:hypothetical protein
MRVAPVPGVPDQVTGKAVAVVMAGRGLTEPAVVRQLVAEAAWQARRRSPTVRAYFERVQRGDP